MWILIEQLWRACSPTSVFLLSIILVASSFPSIVLSPNVGLIGLQQSGNEWYIYNIDQGARNSLNVDSHFIPHISYHGGGTNSLGYAYWKSGSWLIETVDDRNGAGHHTSLALNESDSPSIAYWNVWPHPDSNALMWTWWNGTGWTFEKLESNTLGGADMSLDLDSNELPRISYMKRPSLNDTHHLWFAKMETNGTWNLTLLDSDGNFRYTSLFIDWRDWYHISYEDQDADDLRYACWNGSSWQIEKADTEGDVGSWSSMKVDRNGRPHIAYHDYTHRSSKYATKVNNTWETTIIGNSNGPGLSLDLDSFGRPHMSYLDLDWHVRHAWWNGSAWLNETVDNRTIAGEVSSMRIDERDVIHISYYDREKRMVKYATTKPLPTGEIVATFDIDPDTLNLKSKGKFITAYIELEGADVRNINASSILLNDALSPILDTKYGFVTSEDSYIVDNDQDGIMERMVKFDRNEVQMLLDPSVQVVITITGSLFDRTEFEGSDTIRVIDPG